LNFDIVSDFGFWISDLMRYHNHWFLVFLCICILSCAKEGFPPGGPADTTPPGITATHPQTMASGVERSSEIAITFSEPMDHASVEQALYIVPRLARDPEYRWKQSTLMIRCREPLAMGRTYTITVGAAAGDLHGNRLPDSYTLAFSTGAKVDRGKISGVVGYEDGKKTPCLLWAYILGNTDSLNPAIREPDYITQANAAGAFTFGYISPGRYRIFAVLDKNNDELYTPGVDLAAPPPQDLTVTDTGLTVAGGLWLLARHDSAGPHAIEAAALDNRHVRVNCDVALTAAQLRAARFWIGDSATTAALAVTMVGIAEGKQPGVLLVTAPQRGQVAYRLVAAMPAVPGESVPPETLFFSGSDLPDTVRPAITSLTPRDSAVQVSLDEALHLTFSKSMDTTGIPDIRLADSLGAGITGNARWQDPWRLVWRPQTVLRGSTRYLVRVRLAASRDAGGLEGRDTMVQATFRTVNEDTLGKLTGRITDQRPAPGQTAGRYIVRFAPVDRPEAARETLLPQAGPFAFNYLVPGRYRLCAYQDTDGDSVYDAGRLAPYVPPEPFTELPEPVVIRAQWEVEEVALPFK
jgi:uncharacterized protein (DUF2141 family)